jgi:endonuclease-8
MPEGDTIHRAAAVLRSALLGQRVERFEAPRVRGLVPRVGSTVEAVEARGKHLEITFDDGVVLHTHLRLSGSWHLYRPQERWRKRPELARVVLQTEAWLAVCFSAPVVEVYRQADRRRHPGLGSLGPDLCLPTADLVGCVERMARFAWSHEQVADALLDQRIACGVGNVYKSEVLWACALDPFTPVEHVDEPLRLELLGTASRLLQANLDGGARATLPGGGLAVYGRAGKPCRRCHTTIEVARQGPHGRLTYWCPGCQRDPGRDGATHGPVAGGEPVALAGHGARLASPAPRRRSGHR